MLSNVECQLHFWRVLNSVVHVPLTDVFKMCTAGGIFSIWLTIFCACMGFSVSILPAGSNGIRGECDSDGICPCDHGYGGRLCQFSASTLYKTRRCNAEPNDIQARGPSGNSIQTRRYGACQYVIYLVIGSFIHIYLGAAAVMGGATI